MGVDQMVPILPLHTNPNSNPMLLLHFGIVPRIARFAHIIAVRIDIFKLKLKIILIEMHLKFSASYGKRSILGNLEIAIVADVEGQSILTLLKIYIVSRSKVKILAIATLNFYFYFGELFLLGLVRATFFYIGLLS